MRVPAGSRSDIALLHPRGIQAPDESSPLPAQPRALPRPERCRCTSSRSATRRCSSAACASRLPFGIVLIRESSRAQPRLAALHRHAGARDGVDEIPEGRCVVPAPHHGNCYHIVCRGDERFRVTTSTAARPSTWSAISSSTRTSPSPGAGAGDGRPARRTAVRRVLPRRRRADGRLAARGTPGERTLMFDMSVLVSGQARLHGRARRPSTPRTITVPSLPNDPAALANVVASELNVQPSVSRSCSRRRPRWPVCSARPRS